MSDDTEKLVIARFRSSDIAEALRNCSLFWNMDGAGANLLRFLEDPNCIMLAASVDGEPAGQIVGHLLKRWDARASMTFIYSIDVTEKYRRKGIGKKLVDQFNTIAKEEGCSETFVLTDETNRPAVNLYQSTGAIRVFPDQVMFLYNHGESGEDTP